jgi:hypothetical protein
LRYGADLRVGGSDRRKKTANQNRPRIKNRSPPETEKMPDHKKKEGGESEMLLIGSIFRALPCVVKTLLHSGIPCLLTKQQIFRKPSEGALRLAEPSHID